MEDTMFVWGVRANSSTGILWKRFLSWRSRLRKKDTRLGAIVIDEAEFMHDQFQSLPFEPEESKTRPRLVPQSFPILKSDAGISNWIILNFLLTFPGSLEGFIKRATVSLPRPITKAMPTRPVSRTSSTTSSPCAAVCQSRGSWKLCYLVQGVSPTGMDAMNVHAL